MADNQNKHKDDRRGAKLDVSIERLNENAHKFRKEMEKVRREYIVKARKSEKDASEIILNT